MKRTTSVLDENLTVYAFRLAASNPDAKSHLLKELSRHEDNGVRVAVAGNQNTPKGILADFCKVRTNTPTIREAAASNNSTPMDALRRIANDRDGIIRVKARANLDRRRVS